MPWRKSLLVTAILVGLEFASGQLLTIVLTFLMTTSPQLMSASPTSVGSFVLILTWVRIFLYAVVSFFVVAWALHSQRRTGRLSAQDALDMLDEEQVRELKNLLIAPSQRAE
jgi:hypothetical protein